MVDFNTPQTATDAATPEITVELYDRNWAAMLAWLLPGGGHAYQGRWGKSILFFTCIMGTFCFGMYLGDCKVVYASWGPQPDQRRLSYFLQLGVGLPSMPALVQANFNSRPLGTFMAPPEFPPRGQLHIEKLPDGSIEHHKDELAKWNLKIEDFELGTVYTMIAGLLNILAIYDAWSGPVMAPPEERRKKPKKDDGEQPVEEPKPPSR